jgi:acetyl-CoA acetyltransferase
MSRAPFVMGKADAAFSRAARLEDTTMGWRFVNPKMQAKHGVDSMPETAEHVAEAYGISRADQDAFALRSQQRTAAAARAGFFAGELFTVEVPGRKGVTQVTEDEHPRPDTTLDALARLKPIVRPATVTTSNASGVNDGVSCCSHQAGPQPA